MNAKQSKSTKQNSKSNIRVCGRLRTNVFVCLDGDHPDKPLLLIADSVEELLDKVAAEDLWAGSRTLCVRRLTVKGEYEA
jgi:hypothetical protein